MSEPPAYEEVAGGLHYQVEGKAGEHQARRLNLRDEVSTSREQHTAAVANNLAPKIRDRAKQGLADTTFVLLPTTQNEPPEGVLSGFADGERPILIELGSALDSVEFWSQKGPLDMLKSHLIRLLDDEATMGESVHDLLQPPVKHAKKSSWWSRKSKPGGPHAVSSPANEATTTVDVRLDDVHFRSENPAGLMETVRCHGVYVSVEVRSPR